MDDILRYPNAVRRDPRIEAWFSLTDPLRLMTREWFERMRRCGRDIREILHDGCPVACVGDAPFAYVNAFKAHANVGFYHGAALADPAGLLEGEGKHMRHVKLRPGAKLDDKALETLIAAAYEDIQQRIAILGEDDMTMKKTAATKKTATKKKAPAARRAAAPIKEGDWRSETLDRVRALMKATDPKVTETAKWKKPSNKMRGVPVWERNGIICTGETYKDKVKLTFACGAALKDPSRLFNSSLDGGTRRAIDIHEGDKINDKALKALVRDAIALNVETSATRAAARKKTKRA